MTITADPSIQPSQAGTAFSLPGCTLCGAALRIVLDLGEQPLANALLRNADDVAPVYPLRLGQCAGCGHLQLADRVPPEELFSEYLYETGASAPMVDHFGLLAQVLAGWLGGLNKLVVEVGSNDGTLLRALRGVASKHAEGLTAIGVDPSSVAREVPGTISKFFGVQTAREILAEHGAPGAVVLCNVLAHAPNPRDLLEGARDLLPYGGVLVIEVPYAGNFTYDQCYHEHAHVFSATVLDRLLTETGFMVQRVQKLPVHGGTLRIFAWRIIPGSRQCTDPDWWDLLEAERAWSWDGLQEEAETHRERLRALCGSGRGVVGYGAPAKASVLLNWCGIRPDALYDTTEAKRGRYVPGVGTPIRPLSELPPDAERVLLACWNYADTVLPAHPQFKGRWIVPFPEVRTA